MYDLHQPPDPPERPEECVGDVIERRQGPSGEYRHMWWQDRKRYTRLQMKGVFERVISRTGCKWRYIARENQLNSVYNCMEMEEGANSSEATLWHLREIVSHWWRHNKVNP